MKKILFSLLFSCQICVTAQVIPTPQKMKIHEDEICEFNHIPIVYSETENPVVSGLLKKEVFGDFRETGKSRRADVVLVHDENQICEGYRLEISRKRIVIKAADDRGFLYAVQTLRQLIEDARRQGRPLPCAVVEDAPRVAYRSLMLDSGRQYHRISTLKKYIDLLCMLKMNAFHWHLTEGLGWRVEIKQYPRLTSVGAFVADGEEQQGFYTQQEVRELVAYAADRGVTIVPEIDMPGHASAALAAYPSLNCFDEPIKIPTKGYTAQIFCAGKDSTLVFLKRVMDEVCDMFPSEYIHIGGDEAPKWNWKRCPDCQKRMEDEGLEDAHQLQLWLTKEIASYLNSKGRKAVCWGDVVYHKGYELPSNVVVQWWNYKAHGDLAVREAKERGLKVICSSNFYTYLNFPLTPWRKYKAERCFDLYDAYMRNPSDEKVDDESALGMSAALWTDDGLLERWLDERLFPRIFALSEQMWHRGTRLPFEEFYHLVMEKKVWFESMGYMYGPVLKTERKVPE